MEDRILDEIQYTIRTLEKSVGAVPFNPHCTIVCFLLISPHESTDKKKGFMKSLLTNAIKWKRLDFREKYFHLVCFVV